LNKNILSRISLGTAQFGLDYGITNNTGQIDSDEADLILAECLAIGINSIDTAIAYGNAENALGNSGVGDFDVVTKLPPLPRNIEDVQYWVFESVLASMKRLNLTKLDGLLLHRSADLVGEYGGMLMTALNTLKERQIVNKVGISIYDPAELDALGDLVFTLDMVQAPYNAFDQSLEITGWLLKLNTSKIEVQARSIFLQGILLASSIDRSDYFSNWGYHFDLWDSWLKDSNQTAMEACINAISSNQAIDKIVVGVQGIQQLREVVEVFRNIKAQSTPNELHISDKLLIHPSNWS
jgi:aryl-alcohol dehydrogenase-like predicted oxidoreductase